MLLAAASRPVCGGMIDNDIKSDSDGGHGDSYAEDQHKVIVSWGTVSA
jgi:hypothetical protein